MQSWLVLGKITFSALDRNLRSLGWQRDADAVVVDPVEPAFASWSRDADGQLEYVFSEALHVRALSLRGEDTEHYLMELKSIAELVPSPLMLSQWESMDAKTIALAMAEIVKAQVMQVLLALRDDTSGDVMRQLMPRATDYRLVFDEEIATAAQRSYEKLWADSEHLWRRPGPQQRDVLCYVAPAGMLAYENELSRPFPGGYQAIASKLEPSCVWVAWKYVEPGASSGLAFNGLVWVNDHWAWFPKPYRVLRPYL